jgi:hypothetical protein
MREQSALSESAAIDWRLTNAACCENLFQLFGPVNDHAQTTSMRTAPQHNEPPVARHVVVRDRDRLPEVIFIREQGHGFPKRWLGSRRVDGHRPRFDFLPAVLAFDASASDNS